MSLFNNNQGGAGGLFSNTGGQQQQQQQQQGGGIFGGMPQQQQQQNKPAQGGLFGGNPQGGLFGGNTAQGGLLGGNTANNMGGQQQQQDTLNFLDLNNPQLKQQMSLQAQEIYHKLEEFQQYALLLEKKKFILAYEQDDQKRRLDRLKKLQEEKSKQQQQYQVKTDISKELGQIKQRNNAIMLELVTLQCQLDRIGRENEQVEKDVQSDFEMQKHIKEFQARLNDCKNRVDLLKPKVSNYQQMFENRKITAQQTNNVVLDGNEILKTQMSAAKVMIELKKGLQELQEFQEIDRVDLDNILYNLENRQQSYRNGNGNIPSLFQQNGI